MTTVAIRKKLTDYLKIADDKKIKAIYALLEDEIEQPALEYDATLKKELDDWFETYKKGGKMISGNEAKKQIKKILES